MEDTSALERCFSAVLAGKTVLWRHARLVLRFQDAGSLPPPARHPMWNAPLTRRSFGLGILSSVALKGLLRREPSRVVLQGGTAGAQTGAGASNPDAARWDRVFGQPQPMYRTSPNAFLAAAVERMQREQLLSGKAALDLAMGDGRNALLLAEKGLDVTGIDISPVALERARASAAERKLSLHALEQDLFTFDYGAERWDLITVIYFNPAVQIFDRLKAAVRPGGVIAIEGQGSEHEGDGPPPVTRYRPNQLLQAFGDWRILHYEDGVFECDWAPGPPTHVVRLMARKVALRK